MKRSKEALTKEFENIANRIFETKNQTFTEQSKSNLESLLQPFKENISEFKARVENIYTEETRERSSLRTELNALRDLNLQLNEGAKNLTNALKGDKKKQGTWGELVLERIFEISGLTKGSEYRIQVSGIGIEGARYQPDAIVYLPDNKQIIVDAKTSLVAYEKYFSAEEESIKRLHSLNILMRLKSI
ncbi:MAG: DNA recombination protein RmuC [Ignavibacteriales bacterium]|nr:DNA recombination protein RmuC [Ignavibacteriales bacterium]